MQVWAAESTVSGHTFTVLLSALLEAPSSFALGEAVAVESNSTSSLIRGPAAVPLHPSDEFSFALWNIAPVGKRSGWAVLGEVTTKWVGVSPARVTSITDSTTGVRVLARGAAGEHVVMSFAPPAPSAAAQARLSCM